METSDKSYTMFELHYTTMKSFVCEMHPNAMHSRVNIGIRCRRLHFFIAKESAFDKLFGLSG
jgi:hypothetical protein